VTQTPQDDEDYNEALKRCGNLATIQKIVEEMKKVKEERKQKGE
jgi:hypothetical protein